MRSFVSSAVILSLALSAPAFAAEPAEGSASPSASSSVPSNPGGASQPDVNEVLQKFQAVIDRQSAQLEEQRREIEQQRQELDAIHGQLQHAAGIEATSTSAAPAADLRAAVLELGPSSAGTGPAVHPLLRTAAQGAPAAADADAPLYVKIGAAKFTPGGFLDLTAVYRSTNATGAIGNVLGTSFASIPYSNTVGGGLSEIRVSGQNTRFSLRTDVNVGKAQVFGYGEADFNGYMPYNAYVSTNSDTVRLRVFFADIRYGKWEVEGGQDWSLLSPNRVGASVLPVDVYTTSNTDTNYNAGYIYARQGQFRVLYHPSATWTLGASIEDPEQLTGSAVTFPALFSTTQIDGNSATVGQNTGTPNVLPDFIFKAAADHRWGGRLYHFEASGLLVTPKIVTPASVTKAESVTDTRTGGGGSLNVNLEVVKNLHLIANSFWSDGGGRYIGGLAPEFVVSQPGTVTSPFQLSLLHAGSGLGAVEWQANRKLLLSTVWSAAYIGRSSSIDPSEPNGPPVGYGFAKSANSNNRIIREGTFAFNYTLWKTPSRGALQVISQSSYALRAPWYVATTPGTPKDAHLFLQFTSLRYTLP